MHGEYSCAFRALEYLIIEANTSLNLAKSSELLFWLLPKLSLIMSCQIIWLGLCYVRAVSPARLLFLSVLTYGQTLRSALYAR